MRLKQALRVATKNLFFMLYPRPFKISKLGPRSVIMFPRRIDGARHISIGENTIIAGGGWISAYERYLDDEFQPRILIGNNVRIGPRLMLTAINEITIGDGCLLSADVFISDHTHGHLPSETPPARQPLSSKGSVHIGKHCFIGIRTTIMSGVSLGNYCVVGAHSVVTHSFPERSVVAGSPARLIRTLPYTESL